MTVTDEVLTDAAIAAREDQRRLQDQTNTEWGHARGDVAPGAHPDDLFIHISAKDVNELPPHIWLKFKSEVLGYVANKLKDLGT